MKHLSKKHSLHSTWVLGGLGLVLSGMIIQAYITTLVEFESQSTSVLGEATQTSASVPANPDNTLALLLSQKEKNLDERAAALDQRSLEIDQQITRERNKMILFLLAGGMLILILIGFNFYLDFKHRKSAEDVQKKSKFRKKKT